MNSLSRSSRRRTVVSWEGFRRDASAAEKLSSKVGNESSGRRKDSSLRRPENSVSLGRLLSDGRRPETLPP